MVVGSAVEKEEGTVFFGPDVELPLSAKGRF
jgi:hypothetical protein